MILLVPSLYIGWTAEELNQALSWLQSFSCLGGSITSESGRCWFMLWCQAISKSLILTDMLSSGSELLCHQLCREYWHTPNHQVSGLSKPCYVESTALSTTKVFFYYLGVSRNVGLNLSWSGTLLSISSGLDHSCEPVVTPGRFWIAEGGWNLANADCLP